MNDCVPLLLLRLCCVIVVLVGKCRGVIGWIGNGARGFRVNVKRGCTRVQVVGGMHRVCVLESLAR